MKASSEELLASALSETERARAAEDRELLAAALFQLATLYQQRDEPMKATAPLQELLALHEDRQDRQGIVGTLLMLGD
ncbi:MAG: hypothetical protein HY278_08730, partial [candidate division NC10 bacterium]|nr:hypothetical protein [candidate division NC10 bacterium]